ncbi:MAG: agmatine deiminase family protein [Saprospiraceae bacterium]
MKTSAFLFYLLLTSFSVLSQNFYTQNNLNRTAAEWEPAIGTMITYPLCVPYKLAIELAKDNHLYTLVKNEEAKNEAISWYNKWGIDASRNTFITTSQGVDAWWTRDWGPSAVFSSEGKMMLADPKYIYSTPDTKIGCSDSLHFLFVDKDNNIIKTEADDNAILPIGKTLNIPVLDLPFVSTGGNFITDGLGSAFSTCVLLNENNYYKVPQEKFLKLNKKLLGINNYNIISNFEKYGIQHIDCFMKLLDEERILVAEPPKNHELYPIYENIVENELKKLKTAYGRPYKILRLKTARYSMEKLAAYTNSIIVNKTIYVPLFQIKTDSAALKTWQQAMPGYTVKGFEFALKDEPVVSAEMQQHYKSGYGWSFGDALHCRTRAVWDSEMLFITTKRIVDEVDAKNRNIVFTTIIDYSKKGLELDKSALYWRVKSEENWKTIPLKSSGTKDHYFAEIPFHQSGKTVEYYISAESKSGKKETQPRTAPLGMYEFKIK